MAHVYSIRESLQGSLQTFVRDSGLDSTFIEELVRDFVVSLSAYREEDKPIFPEVYLAHTKADLASILTTGKPLQIGSTSRKANPAAVILKDCAQLAKEGWAIFVHLEEAETVRYGLFRSTRHSLSTGADEVIADLGVSVKLIMLRNCGHQSVEIWNTSKGRLTAVLKVAQSVPNALEDHVSPFVFELTRAVEEPEELRAYLLRVLINTIQHCHGTLMVVIGADDETTRENTQGILLEPEISFTSLHEAALRLRDADSLADLRAAEVLLEGMIGSDGIVVFGPNGTVRAYRLFVRPTNEEGASIPSDGGARRRAFEVLKLRLGTQYSAAFYRSQDGETKCEVVTNVK